MTCPYCDRPDSHHYACPRYKPSPHRVFGVVTDYDNATGLKCLACGQPATEGKRVGTYKHAGKMAS